MAAVSRKYIRKIQNKYTECRHIGNKPLSEPMMTKFFFYLFLSPSAMIPYDIIRLEEVNIPKH